MNTKSFLITKFSSDIARRRVSRRRSAVERVNSLATSTRDLLRRRQQTRSVVEMDAAYMCVEKVSEGVKGFKFSQTQCELATNPFNHQAPNKHHNIIQSA